jgi:Tfp pilus assembly protein PilO
MKLTSRTIAFVIFGVVAVVAVAGWFVVVSPKRSQASKLAATIQDKQTAISAAQQQQQPQQQGSGSSPQQSSASADAALPDTLGMPEVVDQLNHLAARAGVTLDGVTPQLSAPGAGYMTTPISVVVDGHYFGVEKFLHLVRTQVRLDKSTLSARGRLFDVQGVQLQQTEPAPMITATLSLDTFYYAPTATLTPPATTTTTASAG